MKLTKTVEISQFCTIQVHGLTKVKGHDKRVIIVVEPKNNGYSPSVVAMPSYANLKPGSSNVNMNLRNLTSRSIMVKTKSMVKAKSIVAQVAATNIVPSMLTSKNQRRMRIKEWNPLI